MEIHPQYLMRNGKEEFVILPFDEFVAMQDLLADAEDVLDLREAKKQDSDEPSISLFEVKKRLGLES